MGKPRSSRRTCARIAAFHAKTASRNVAFKVARMRESIMEDQDVFIIRDSGREEVGLEANNRAALEDIGYNTDLCIANQECNTQS